MTRVYDFAAKLSGSLALVCAILAVLATPSSARADDLTNCQNCCAQTYTWGSIEYQECVSQCMQGAGPCNYGPIDLPCINSCTNGCANNGSYCSGSCTGCISSLCSCYITPLCLCTF